MSAHPLTRRHLGRVALRTRAPLAGLSMSVFALSLLAPTAATAAGGPFGAVPLGGSWSNATALTGVSSLNLGHTAYVTTIACQATGNCTGAGVFTDASHHTQVFVASELAGSWRAATVLPGITTLNDGGSADAQSISCASPGNCALGGQYRDHAGNFQAFVAAEVSGSWQSAIELPGSISLNSGGAAEVLSMSCPQNGRCSAGGFYSDHAGNEQAFVADMSNGLWTSSVEVPGTSVLNLGASARTTTISCPSAGACVAAGEYTDSTHHVQVFVVRMSTGIWQNALEIPGTSTLNLGGDAAVNSISCASADNCSLVGSYADAANRPQAFAAVDQLATWHLAAEVPGTAALNVGGDAALSSVTCSSLGRCAAVGHYLDAKGHRQAMVVDEVSGVWQNAAAMPASSTLNVGGSATALDVACATAGNCVVVGSYTDGAGRTQALVDQEVGGTWLNAQQSPSSQSLNVGGVARLTTVACAHAGTCSAGGYYSSSASSTESLVDVYVPPPTGIATSSLRTGIAALAGNLFTVDPLHGWVVEQSESTGAVLRTVVVAGASEIVSDGAHLWVSSRTTNSVVELSAAGAVMRRVGVGVGPTFLSVSGPRLIVVDASASAVSIVSLATFKAAAAIKVGGVPVAAVITGANFWVDVTTNRVLEYSLSSAHLVRSVTTGSQPSMMAANATSLFVANRGSATLSVVSLGVPGVRTFTQAGAGAFQPVLIGSAVFVTDSSGYAVAELSAASGALVKSIQGVFQPREMASDNGFLWVTSNLSHQITRIAALGV